MAASRRLIVPPYFPRGMIGAAAFAGLLAGGTYSVVLWISSDLRGWFAGISLRFLISLGTPLLMTVGFSVAIAVVLPRRKSVAFLSIIYCIAMAVATVLAVELKNASDAGYSADFTSPKWLILLTLLTFVAVLLGGFTGSLVEFFFRRLVTPQEQDGLWCWKCGYRIGQGAIDTCPECGTSADPSRFRYAALHRLVSLGKRRGSIGVILSGLALVVFMVAKGSDADTFASLREEFEKLGPAQQTYFYLPGSSRLQRGPACDGVRIPLDSSATLELIAACRRPPRSGEPALQLQICRVRVADRTSPSSIEPALVMPRVLCDLTARQAVHIVRYGVPRGLQRAMIDASADQGTASDPARPDIRIDPVPFFPNP